MGVVAPSSDGLKLWQRFHFRLTAMYGALVLAVLILVAGFFYVRGVDRELAALKSRILVAATSLAATIEPDELADLRAAEDVARPAYRALDARFRAVASADPELSDLYIMRRGDTPGSLVAAVDVVLVGDAPPMKPGELYESTHLTKMLEGFERPTVEDAPYTDAWGTVLSGYAPIRGADGVARAIVGLDVRATRLTAIKREVATLVLVVLAVAIAALVALGAIVARKVRRPLAQIVEATNAIAAGNLHVRAKLDRADEFGVVGKHFDHMATGLEEREFIKATFGQYVAPEVVQTMLAERSEAVRGQRRHVAVMFVDLRKFTTLSEGMAPEDVVALLNSYLDRMTSVITRFGGRIDKFIGDAILADWGTLSVPGARAPEAAAVDAALAMLHELDAWNAERARTNDPPIALGIALHAGEVVAGSIGSARKLEYTIIGDAVNVASRLEGLCKVFGATLVVSSAIVEGAGCHATARWLDELVLRGRNVSTEVYEILDPADPRHAHLAAYAEGVRQLRAGELAAARTSFEGLLAHGPDPVVDHQLQRTAA